MAQEVQGHRGIERRRYNRLNKSLDLQFGVWKNVTDLDPDREGTLLDIGGGGLRFLTDEKVEIGTQLFMVLEFPGWKDNLEDWVQDLDGTSVGVLKVVGMVVRCMVSILEPGKYEVAVCFCGRLKK